MNVKNLMLLLAFTGLGVSCTNDDGLDRGGDSSGAANEIQLVFTGSSESEEYTKAPIASEKENQIDNLNVYVFASTDKDGTYYYMETWKKGAADDKNAQFTLQPSGSSFKASIYPHEQKGLPFLKLYCVANPQDKLYAEDGTAEIALTAVTTDATGAITNGAAATKEEDFEKSFTKAMEAADILTPSLVMTGNGQTKISGSVSKVNIDLKRVVARFDIENTMQTSQLTIETITLAHARKTGALFGHALSPVADAQLDTDLATYKEVDFKAIANANQGTAESALYVYPTLDTDKSYLIIKGKFKSAASGNQVDVTYHVPIVKAVDGQPDGTPSPYIPIKANSRYKLRIVDVTNSNLYATFEIEDWTSGGGVNIKPDNAAPAFKELTAGTITPVLIAGTTNQYKLKEDAGNFSIVMTSTGEVLADKALATKAGSDWLTIGQPEYKQVDGLTVCTFPITVAGATGQQPVAVTFKNDAASSDPDLQTSLVFYGPLAAPGITDASGHSIGNTVNVTDPAAPTASMYKVNGSKVMLNVTCIEGVANVTAPAGFKVTEGATEGYKATYTIEITDATTATGTPTIVFMNKEDNNVKTTLTVTLNEPGLTAAQGTNATGAADYSNLTASGNITIDMDKLGNGNFTFKVNAPQGLTAPSMSSCTWLNITETHAWADADGQRYAEYQVEGKAGASVFADYTIAFTNLIPSAPNLNVTLKKAPSKPKFAANDQTGTYINSTFNTEPVVVTDPTAATTSMYLANNSLIYVKVTCPENFTFSGVNGLAVTEKTAGIYEIKITDASLLTAGNTITLEATNSSVKSTLAIVLTDPKIVVTKNADTQNAVTITNNTINVDAVTLGEYNGFKVEFSGYKGSTITYSNLSATWLSGAASNPSVLDNNGKAIVELLRATAGNKDDTTDITITIHNAVTGQDEVFTISKQ